MFHLNHILKLLLIFDIPKPKATPKGSRALKLKTSNPGLKIIKTPINPKKLQTKFFYQQILLGK